MQTGPFEDARIKVFWAQLSHPSQVHENIHIVWVKYS